jgi:hypothetical protein
MFTILQKILSDRKVVFTVAVLFALLLMLSLGGCRKSDVITQIIYDQTAKVIDYNAPPIIHEIETENTNIDLPTKKTEDVEKKTEEKKVAASEGDSDSEDEIARKVPDKKADKVSDVTEAPKKDPKEEPDQEEKGDEDAGKDDETQSASEDPESRQITDDKGNVIDLPEDVNSVVAAGDAALIVQMLGGSNILAGTSSGFSGNALAKSVFSDEGLSSAKNLWGASGATAMSAANFKTLIGLKPDACIGMPGESTFSDAQIKELKENKIAYVTLPGTGTHDNIVSAVKIAGNLIGDRSEETGGVNALTLSEDYESYCNDLIDSVTDKVGGRFTWNDTDFNNDYNVNGNKAYSGKQTSNGKYTLLISGWDSAATYSMKDGEDVLFKEKGLAVAPQGYSGSPVSFYMSVGGACNNGARFSNDKKDQYAALPVNVNILKNVIDGSSLSVYPETSECFTWAQGRGVDAMLGSEEFPAVVVESDNTKKKIQASRLLWKPSEQITVGSKTDYGFEANGRMILSYIRDDYDVFVNPCGIESWLKGSPESILEMVWTSNVFNGKYDDSAVKEEIKNFYTKFYRYDLSGTEVNNIIKGK